MVAGVATPRVLLIEGRSGAGGRLRRVLVYAGYETVVAHDGRASVAAMMDQSPDVAVIDLDASDYDGLAICRRLRRYSDAPALVLGSRGTQEETIAAFDAGADDYMAPPIALEELQSRVKALLRRARRRPVPSQLRYADISLDSVTHTVTRSGRQVALTATEFDLLALFLGHADEVLSHAFLLDRAWRHPASATVANLEWSVHTLRTKLEAAGEDRLIQTVRGVGYSLRSPAREPCPRDMDAARDH